MDMALPLPLAISLGANLGTGCAEGAHIHIFFSLLLGFKPVGFQDTFGTIASIQNNSNLAPMRLDLDFPDAECVCGIV